MTKRILPVLLWNQYLFQPGLPGRLYFSRCAAYRQHLAANRNFACHSKPVIYRFPANSGINGSGNCNPCGRAVNGSPSRKIHMNMISFHLHAEYRFQCSANIFHRTARHTFAPDFLAIAPGQFFFLHNPGYINGSRFIFRRTHRHLNTADDAHIRSAYSKPVYQTNIRFFCNTAMRSR